MNGPADTAVTHGPEAPGVARRLRNPETAAVLSSFGALMGISLRRTRADWPIVLSAAVVCLMAATVLAAGTIYGSAVATAGLREAIRSAPPQDGAVAVSGWTKAADAGAVEATVATELERALGSVGGRVLRFAQTETFELPAGATGQEAATDVTDLAILGSAEDLAGHATLLEGAWPEAATADGSTPVVVSDAVAGRLGLRVGQRISLVNRIDRDVTATVELVGVFAIDDPGEPYWWADAQVLDGLVATDRYATHGPFFTTPDLLRASTADRPTELTWRAFPAVDRLTPDDMAPLGRRVAELPATLAATGHGLTVESGLADLIGRTERSLLVSRSGVLLLTIQLVVLAAYAALLSASLLVEHRRVGTAILRSRGASSSRIAALALVEGLALTVSAALVAPWLAATLLRTLNLAGPFADIAMTIDPSVSTDAFIAAAVGAGICLVALMLPAWRHARSVASVPAEASRGSTRGLAQRLGLDIALLAVAAVGLWQLRLYGAPLTRSVQGAIGLDPLLVATPALGLLAGALVAIRLVPLLAVAIERAARRANGLVPSLGTRQLARRPLRYTRSALLLVLAMAMGVFAISYTWTWAASQRDQATFQAGADLRVEPGTGSRSTPRWALEQAYTQLPGVTGVLAVDRDSVQPNRSSSAGTLVAFDATTAADVIHLRPDLADAPLTALFAPLAAARPAVETIPLPGTPRTLRLALGIDFGLLERVTFDAESDEEERETVSVEEIGDVAGLASSVVVRDASGQLFRFSGPATTFAPGPHEVRVPLGDASVDGSFRYPIEVVAVELAVSLPGAYQTPDATITAGQLAVDTPDGAWQPVALALPSGWRPTATYSGNTQDPQPAGDILAGDTLLARVGGEGGVPILFGVDSFGGGPTAFRFAPTALDRVGRAAIPVVASDAFLEASGADPGDEVNLVLGGVRRRITVTGTLRAFPATDPTRPAVVMDLATLALLRYAGLQAVQPADEWWLAVTPEARPAILEALGRAPLASPSVIGAVERGRLLARDPVALGVIGGLAIGFVAASVFAIVGFVVSASVSARERVGEFALLRALGLSSRQLSVWLSLENAVLASVSLVAGTLLGLLLAWLILPFITVTQGATAPYPPVDIDVPWGLVGLLIATAVLALGATVASLAWLLPRIRLSALLRGSED